eukprot:COSAG06_NODE_45564_length_353_cov_22.307087_1_plen_25_part_01
MVPRRMRMFGVSTGRSAIGRLAIHW